MIILDEDMKKAIDRIARTPDGLLLYRWLQRQLLGVASSSEQGALLENHGHRKFAQILMAHMAEGIDSGGSGTGEPSGSAPSERPVTFAVRQSAAVSTGQRGAGRRIDENTRVPGYDRQD